MPPAPSYPKAPLAFTRGERLAICMAAWGAACICVIAFISHISGHHFLVLNPGDAWMVPSTALTLPASCICLGLLQFRKKQLFVRGLTIVSASATILVCAVFSYQSISAVAPTEDWEFWLTNICSRGVAETHFMRMAPATALILGLSSVTLLIIAVAPVHRRVARQVGLIISLVLLTICGISILGQAAGIALLPGEGSRPMAFSTALALAALNFALALACGLRRATRWALLDPLTNRDELQPAASRWEERLVESALLMVALLLVVGGFYYLKFNLREQRAEVAARLASVLELKSVQIATWRNERVADARAFMHTPLLAGALLASRTESGKADLRANFGPYFQEIRKVHGYDALVLLDPTLAPALTLPGDWTHSPSPEIRHDLPLRHDVLGGNLQPGDESNPGIDLYAPVWSADDQTFAGAVMVRVDVHTQLLALIQEWPSHPDAAEIIIVHRAGSFIFILNGRPALDRSTATQRVPVEYSDPISLEAVRAGQFELTEGVDYRGVPVLAVARRIAGSPDVMIAKIDRIAAYAPLRAEVIRVAIGVTLLITLISLLLGNFWRKLQQAVQAGQNRAEHGQKAAEERLGLVLQSANDVILLLDEHLRVVEANERALLVYGRNREEMLRLHVDDLRALTRATTEDEFSDQIPAEGRIYETMHRHRNGEVFPVEVSIRPVQIEGLHHYLSIVRDITRRRNAEDSLRKLSRTVDQAPLSIVMTDLSGVIEYANPYFTTVTGYSLEEVRGQNPRILKSGVTAPEVYAEMWRTLASGHVWRGELHNRKKNGDLYVELAVIAPVFDHTGRATHYVALKEDITDRTRIQLALRHSEERFRAIFEHAEVGMFETNPDGYITRGNRFLSTMLGYPLDQLIGRHWLEFAPYEAQRQALAPPPTNPQQQHFLTREDHVFWGQITSKCELDPHGRPAGYICLLQDISIQVEARERLMRFNSELETKVVERTEELASRNYQVQALLQSIPDTVMRLRADGTVLHYQSGEGSLALDAMLHPTGSSAPFQAPPDLVAISLALGRRALAENRTMIDECELPAKEGQLALELRAAPSGANEFVVFVRDISQRKRHELETAANLDRERQVSEMKTRFIAVTSHEFRTPMAAALGSVELLANHLEHLKPPKRQELLDRITSALRRMTVMLDDLLTLERTATKEIAVQRVTVDLRDFVAGVIEEIRLGDHSAHAFEFEPVGADFFLATDPALLHHVLGNLLSNAVRYSAAGQAVTVRLEAEAERVRLIVQDRGIGIPPGDLDRIFEPFERGSNVGNIKGTGLGLNIVKRMTEALGGTIAVVSSGSDGSRFILTFSRIPAPPPTS